MIFRLFEEADLENLEKIINEYFELLEYFQHEIVHFEIKPNGFSYMASLVHQSKKLNNLEFMSATFHRDNLKNKNPERFEYIESLIEKFKVVN